jgi:hypothetical protein
MRTPRGLLIGSIPGPSALWESPPNGVTRADDWVVARFTSGTQPDWGREMKFPFWRIQVRWALVVAALALYPLMMLLRVGLAASVRRRRRRRGLCLQCGYDLRGSPGLCPECGVIASR